MDWSVSFFLNAALLGVGLAMDAFSVSLANGLNDPNMRRGQMLRIAGCFAGFQLLMPMIGWICVRTVAATFAAFQRAVPWIALILLGWIGGKMLYEGIRHRDDGDREGGAVDHGTLLVQGVATSIDALSVGFTIERYGWPQALAASTIIAAVTLAICLGGLRIGRKFGTRLAGKASILGGTILVLIGLEIFIKNMYH